MQMARARELADYFASFGLVGGIADKGKGQMYFICGRQLDIMLPTVFPVHDPSRYAILHNETERTILDKYMHPFAQRHAHLVPISRREHRLGL
eukprot:SAG11_NODE_2076_length_3856_cov_15.369178_3_plen_93_part_00